MELPTGLPSSDAGDDRASDAGPSDAGADTMVAQSASTRC
jgi:hypothetical protein